MIAFLFYFSALGMILAGSSVIPALIAFGFNEIEMGFRILLYGGLGGFIFTGTLLAIRGRLAGISRNTLILLAVFSWIAFPVITAFPLMDLMNLSFGDALFQTMSAFTTSGSTIVNDVEAVPRATIFLLGQFQWLGGVATLITLILVLAPWEVGGLPQVGSASVAASIVASQARLAKFCWRIFQAYLLLTLFCFIALLLIQIPPFKAMTLSFSALSTGGIISMNESLDLLLGVPGMIIMATFMLIGATSIFWHQRLLDLDFEELRKHRESYFVLAAAGLFALLFAYKIADSMGDSAGWLIDSKLLGEGIFNAASIISTTGIQSRPGVFALLPPAFILLVIFVGGGCYSTSGGLKFYRIGAMFSLSEYELNRLIYPSSVKPSRFGATKFDIGMMKAIWSLFAVMIVTVGVTSVVLANTGLGFQPSITAVIAAITNAGSVYSPDWANSANPEWPLYSDMSQLQKGLLSLLMLVGRLEIIAVIACITVIVRKVRS